MNKSTKRGSANSYLTHTNKNKGITIVALIITIVVLLILAVVAITAIQSDGIIGKAKQTAFMNKIKKYEEELNFYIYDKKLETMMNYDESILIANNKTTLSIKDIIKSISKEDEKDFAIRGGKLIYIGNNAEEKQWSANTGITVGSLAIKIYGNSIQEILPEEYQRVEYIESTGEQYIDLGIFPKIDYVFTLKLKGNGQEATPGYYFGFYNGRNNQQHFNFGLATYKTTNYMICSGVYNSASTIHRDSFPIINEDTEIICGNLYVKIDDKKYSDTKVSTEFTGGKTLYLFAVNHAYDIWRASFKCRGFDVELNGEPIRNLIPCYRKSDNVVGMYDTVENKFYTNQGTGTFLKGNDVVPTPDNPIEIESVGDFDETTGKYKIPIKVNNDVTNIYLDEPLRKIGDYADYIDFENEKVVRKVEVIDDTGTMLIEQSYKKMENPTEETIELPKITNGNISVETKIQPSNVEYY